MWPIHEDQTVMTVFSETCNVPVMLDELVDDSAVGSLAPSDGTIGRASHWGLRGFVDDIVDRVVDDSLNSFLRVQRPEPRPNAPRGRSLILPF